MDILNSLISAGAGLFGVWIGYYSARKQGLLDAKREIYGAVISNLDSNFKFRELEEADRILSKATAIAKPELQSLLKDYKWVIEVYKHIVIVMIAEAENKTRTPTPAKWCAIEKKVRNGDDFKTAKETMEALMRKEIGIKDTKKYDDVNAKMVFSELKKDIKEANIPIKIYY